MRGLVFFIFVVFVFGVKEPVAPGVTLVKPAQCDDGTTFTREQAWTCIENAVDTNKDRRITVAEIEAAKSAFIPRWKLWALKAISIIASTLRVSHIMESCDIDKDGYITVDDFSSPRARGICLAYMDPHTQWKTPSWGLCRMKDFCDSASQILNKKIY